MLIKQDFGSHEFANKEKEKISQYTLTLYTLSGLKAKNFNTFVRIFILLSGDFRTLFLLLQDPIQIYVLAAVKE